MSATVLKLDELKQEMARKRARTGRCQNHLAGRGRPDFEYHADRLAAGVEDPAPGRFAWDYEAQERMIHALSPWVPAVVVLAAAAVLGWLLLG